jgi:hypothetical protein
MDDDPINKALGIGPLPTNKYIASIVNELNDDSALKDFTFARSNIQEVIQNGIDAIAKLATIADQSQNPRAFEVLAKLMDTVVNASEKLLDVQKKVKEMTKANEPTGDKTVTNNLFVGSTSDLQTILEKLKK